MGNIYNAEIRVKIEKERNGMIIGVRKKLESVIEEVNKSIISKNLKTKGLLFLCI